jgi:hypothetical protein
LGTTQNFNLDEIKKKGRAFIFPKGPFGISPNSWWLILEHTETHPVPEVWEANAGVWNPRGAMETPFKGTV